MTPERGFAMSMITASAWVPRGASARIPKRYSVDDAELSRISKLAKLHLADARHDLQNAKDGVPDHAHTEDSEEEFERKEGPQPKSQG